MKNVEGQRALARALGVSQKTISHWTRHPRWPFGPGPWIARQVALMPAWRARHFMETGRVGTAPAPSRGDDIDDDVELRDLSPEKRARLRLMVERAASLRVDRELKLAGYVRREEAERDDRARAAAVEGELMRAPRLAARMEGKGLQQREQILEDWARGVCNRFAGQGDDDDGRGG